MRTFLAFLLFYLAVLVCICFACSPAQATRSKQNRPNTIDVEQSYDNPNSYMFGSVACGGPNACGFLKDSHERLYTNIRIQPYNTAVFYDEAVLFCGDVSDSFRGKRGALVITYRRQATLNYQGVGCHELTSVFEVPSPKGQQ